MYRNIRDRKIIEMQNLIGDRWGNFGWFQLVIVLVFKTNEKILPYTVFNYFNIKILFEKCYNLTNSRFNFDVFATSWLSLTFTVKMPDFEIFTKLEKKIQNKYKKIMTILKFYYLKVYCRFHWLAVTGYLRTSW